MMKMKMNQKSNINFLLNGGCFLYWVDADHKCLLTHLMIDSNHNWFDDTQEQTLILKHDCGGNIKKCPYIPILWDLEEPPEAVSEEIITPVNKDDYRLQFGQLTIDFDFSLPGQDNDLLTDALLIPTDNSLNFRKFFYIDDQNAEIIQRECRQRQVETLLGNYIITSGAMSGYPLFGHCIIAEENGLQPESEAIALSVYNVLPMLDNRNCQSVAIFPLIMIDEDIIIPKIDLYLKILLTTLETLSNEYDFQGLKYVLIHIPPDFDINLQDVTSDFNNSLK